MRTVVAEGDSSNSLDGAFPVPRDSSWTISYDDKSDPKTYTAVKTFSSVELLNQEYSKPLPLDFHAVTEEVPVVSHGFPVFRGVS